MTQTPPSTPVYDIEISESSSSGIQTAAEALGVTHMREVDSGYARNVDADGESTIDTTGEPDSLVTLYELSNGTRVLQTNADPVWEEEDGFRELAESADIVL